MHIAGLSVALVEPEAALASLETIYGAFASRAEEYARDRRNPYLCRVACSHCCKSGAFFAVTLVEALRWARAVADLHEPLRTAARSEAESLVRAQAELFHRPGEQHDVPGRRDEDFFSARVTRVASMGPACPLLEGDLCSVYEGRPFLCRAYGCPVDAYSVEGDSAIVFRSLCHLYAGAHLREFVRARDLKLRLGELSRQLAGGRDLGRFTSAEAILARLDADSATPPSAGGSA